MTSPALAIVFGTFNRLPLLQRAVESSRVACGSLSCVFLIADGGSTDGSRAWMQGQPDVELLEGGLNGAVAAFNICYSRAVDIRPEAVVTFNDDDWAECPPPIFEEAVKILRARPDVGAVALEMNTRGPWQCEKWAGIPYGNTNVMRLEVGMAVARALGDPTGRAWWGHTHLTYAADTEMGLMVNRLGWTMYEGIGLRVHDEAPSDAMKKHNAAEYARSGTAALFHERWGTVEKCQYNEADAIKFGGRVHS